MCCLLRILFCSIFVVPGDLYPGLHTELLKFLMLKQGLSKFPVLGCSSGPALGELWVFKQRVRPTCPGLGGALGALLSLWF